MLNKENSQDVLLKAYDISHKFDYELFDGVDIELLKSQSIAIVGVSGSGKSTLLHILSSLLKPDDGIVECYGQSLYAKSQKEILKIRREYFGIIFQAHYLFRGFSADENLEVAKILSSSSDERYNSDILDRLGISDIVSQSSTALSGGQQQRLSIARALINKPSMIFADEPTGNLDDETADEVMSMLFDYISLHKAGLILVTHDNDLASKCDIVYKLENKKLIKINKD
jgi:putative ABC transport system ATP-binding protein